MTDYLARKLAGCTYPNCTDDPLADHCMCKRHRDGHRERNKRSTRQRRAMRRAQMMMAW